MYVQGGYMLFRGVICCSGGLYAVQGGYINIIINMGIAVSRYKTIIAIVFATARAQLVPWWIFLFVIYITNYIFASVFH